MTFIKTVGSGGILPPWAPCSDSKMSTGRGNLRTEKLLFFSTVASDSINPSQWPKIGRFCDLENHIFWFLWFLQFLGASGMGFRWILKPGRRILKHFEAWPKDFKAFWSRPGFNLFVLFVYFYLFYLFPLIFIDFYWFQNIRRFKWNKSDFCFFFFWQKITVRKSSFPQPVELVCAIECSNSSIQSEPKT